MPEYALYYLYQFAPDGVSFASISLLEVTPLLCIEGLEYFVTFDNSIVTETSQPLKITQLDIDVATGAQF